MKLTIRNKLYLGFGNIVVLNIIMQIILLLNLNGIANTFQEFINVEIKLSHLAEDIRYYDATLTDAVRAVLIDPTDQTNYDRYNADATSLDGVIAEATTLATSEEERQIFQKIGEVNVSLIEIETQLLENPNIEQARALYRGEYGVLKAQYAEQVALFYTRRTAELEQEQNHIFETIRNTQIMSEAMIVAMLIAGVSVAVYLSRDISKPLQALTSSIEQVGKGDLSQRIHIHSSDETGTLGHAFNKMVENLQGSAENLIAKEYLENAVNKYQGFVARVAAGDLTTRLEMVGNGNSEDAFSDDLYRLGMNLNDMVENLNGITHQVRESVSGIMSATTQIQAATTQQFASTTEQNAAVTQTVVTVEEIRTTVQQTAERAQAVADSAQQSVNVSRRGKQVVENTVEGMNLIQKRVENIAETILSLSERTQQIGEIINTVNAIADQSKLLALNASIEAARVGEEGRGFAIVASEVRQLAEQSKQATSRIGEILNEIQRATNTAVMVTEEGSKETERGMELVNRAGETIRDLASTLEDAAQAAVQIAASTHQQTNGMSQLASAMQQIKQASVQAASSSRQTEQSANDLASTSRQLEQAVARYKVAT